MSDLSAEEERWVDDEVASAAMVPAILPQGTTVPRHIASAVDSTLAMFLCVVVAKQVNDEQFAMQVAVGVLVFFGYFYVFEALFSRTPGKFLTGLKVVDFDGSPCSHGQTCLRTLLRLVEVNPLFLGGLPAAIQIIWSKNKQRLGDRLAGTVVVRV